MEHGQYNPDAYKLFEENKNLAYWFAKRYECKNRLIELDDLIQESLKALWYASRAYKEEKGSFAPYSSSIIIRALNHYVKKFYKHQMITLTKAKYTITFREYKKSEYKTEELEESFNVLTPCQKIAILGKYTGISYTKLAKQLGVTKQAVEYNRRVGLVKLRKAYLGT